MPYLIFLIFLAIVLFFKARVFFAKKLSAPRAAYAKGSAGYEKIARENAGLKNENLLLEKKVNETMALYDITKEICRTLDEAKIFAIFKEAAGRQIKVGDCRFLEGPGALAEYRDYIVLPLNIYEDTLGYLVASDVAALDTEKFYILAQQFLVGVKRAILYKKIQELAITDSLTQVFSRRYFLERFAEELERSKKFRFKFSFLMLDIDRFKDYNDRLGHLVGDAILKEIARLVKENIRQVDFMGRYGGEELCAVLTETGREEALAAAERIRLAVASGKIRAYDEELQATISIGVATFPDDSLDAKEIIERADKALYRAKEAGRNMVCQAEKIS